MIQQGGEASPRDPHIMMRERFVQHLSEDNFVLFSQAIVALSAQGEEPDFREIFVRYKEEEEGLLPAGTFLPILEDQGLLPFLDRWVVFRLLRWCRDAASAAARQRPRCSLNLAIDTVRNDRGFGDYVLGSLERTGVPAESLSFEIQAIDALVYKASLARMIPALRAAGCTFALSGFRGEETDFRLAASLGITFAKLDGMFAAPGLVGNAATKLAAIIRRCRDCGLLSVATLVEDSETLALLRTLNVDYVQGFGIERPRPLYNA
jgi:EAL domain-containing protein (putative c-di-GMP-specific phosphodiesterase class I)